MPKKKVKPQLSFQCFWMKQGNTRGDLCILKQRSLTQDKHRMLETSSHYRQQSKQIDLCHLSFK